MQHVHVVLRDEATDVRVAVRSRSVVQVLPLSWGQRGVLRSRGQRRDEWEYKRCISQPYLEEGGRAHGSWDGQRRVLSEPRRCVIC